MIPFPVRVVVIVIVLLPVFIEPFVILTVATEILLRRFILLLAEDLLMVNILKVVAPLIAASAAPPNVMVLVAAVKLPEFVQLPARVWVKDDALKVVDAPMVRSPFTVIAPPAVFVLPLDRIRL